LPATSRHDDATVHVPTALPPHGATLEQDATALPGLPLVPAAPDPIKLPSVADGLSEWMLQAPAIIPNAIASRVDWIFIEQLPSRRERRRFSARSQRTAHASRSGVYTKVTAGAVHTGGVAK
jgi:hypothetical protein